MKLYEGIDIEGDGIRFSGRAGKHLLFSLLLRAKFREPYEDITLLNDWIADLATRLSNELYNGEVVEFADDAKTRCKIADLIAAYSVPLGWWRMSVEEKSACLKLAAAPYRISDDSINEIILIVSEALDNARLLVEAAENKD